MATAYLSLGCNVGDCLANLVDAVKKLNARRGSEVKKISSVYATEPVGNSDQPDFLNIAVELETTLDPHELLAVCRAIEIELGGRKNRTPLGPRTIDLDILLYGQLEIEDEELMVPHPRMLERAFVLVPLAEIGPGARLPGGVNVVQVLEALTDRHRVEKKQPLPL